jgi:hypothetical protein
MLESHSRWRHRRYPHDVMRDRAQELLRREAMIKMLSMVIIVEGSQSPSRRLQTANMLGVYKRLGGRNAPRA